jgi:hypothetical protein
MWNLAALKWLKNQTKPAEAVEYLEQNARKGKMYCNLRNKTIVHNIDNNMFVYSSNTFMKFF